MTSKTYLYKATAADGELLYVGITSQTNVRMNAHVNNSQWHALMAGVEYFEFPDRDAATAAESEAIRSLRPRFNVTGNPDCRPPMGEVKHITVRMPHALHRRVLKLTIDKQIKIQTYLIGLIEADLERLGVPLNPVFSQSLPTRSNP